MSKSNKHHCTPDLLGEQKGDFSPFFHIQNKEDLQKMLLKERGNLSFLSKEELEIFLPLAKKHGLVGIECYYSLYDEKTTETSLRLAKQFDLLPSGGSDFHGARKPDIKLGVGKGDLKVPYECYLSLKNSAK